MTTRFRNRAHGGKLLAELVKHGAGRGSLVLALARGGVPVGYEVAARLHLPLRVLVVRKLGVPGFPEWAMGAVASGDVTVFDEDILRRANVSPEVLTQIIRREQAELLRREAAYSSVNTALDVQERDVIVVDDGLATGATMRVAVAALRRLKANAITVAAPVGSHRALAQLRTVADDVICVMTPSPWRSVGDWYDDFQDVTDEVVVAAVRAARDGRYRGDTPESTHSAPGPALAIRPLAPSDVTQRVLPCEQTVEINALPHHIGGRQAKAFEVEIPIPGAAILATLNLPTQSTGLIVFAHGSGSDRHSPRNRFVGDQLNASGLGTLHLDLLSLREEALDKSTGQFRFNIALLAERVVSAVDWLAAEAITHAHRIGLFGASTGAAAAIVAAAARPHRIRAIVSRGGRVDLAARFIPLVRCPTLVLVGQEDEEVLALTRPVLPAFRARRRLELLEGASHLFSEAGALTAVAARTCEWFALHLSDDSTSAQGDPSHPPV